MIMYKIKKYLGYYYIWKRYYYWKKIFRLFIKEKRQNFLGITALTREVNCNFDHINVLENYLKREFDIEKDIQKECEKKNINAFENIKQIIKNRKRENYLKYQKEVNESLVRELLKRYDN